jgi:uncharacterized protein (TIGR02145 family)
MEQQGNSSSSGMQQGNSSSGEEQEQGSSSSVDGPYLSGECKWQAQNDGDIIHSTEKMVLVSGGKTITPILTGDCKEVELPSPVTVPTWRADSMLITDIKASATCGEENIEIDCPNIKIKNPGADTFYVDRRDQQIYQTIKINNRELMAENLNYDTNRGSFCYDNLPANCNKYGRLYEADDCDDGWQAPFENFWNDIISPPNEAVRTFIASTGWNVNICDVYSGAQQQQCKNELNKKHFTALPGGSYNRHSSKFEYSGTYGYWWINGGNGKIIKLSSSNINGSNEYREYINSNGNYYSIRCIRATD